MPRSLYTKVAYVLKSFGTSLFQVLEDGVVRQFDQPWRLLQDKAGLFFNMVENLCHKERMDICRNTARNHSFTHKENSHTSKVYLNGYSELITETPGVVNNGFISDSGNTVTQL